MEITLRSELIYTIHYFYIVTLLLTALEPYGYVKDTIKVFTLKPGVICTMQFEVHIPGCRHTSDEMFLPIPSLLYDLQIATALEPLDGLRPREQGVLPPNISGNHAITRQL